MDVPVIGGFLNKYRHAKLAYKNSSTIESRISWKKKIKELDREAEELGYTCEILNKVIEDFSHKSLVDVSEFFGQKGQ